MKHYSIEIKKHAKSRKYFPFIFSLALLPIQSFGIEFDCLDLDLKPVVNFSYSVTPTADFNYRDSLPKTEVDRTNWQTCCGSYGPCPLTYPKVIFPENISKIKWSQLRVVEAAKRLIGVLYGHYHIPDMGGLDCSNFTAFIYNYAFGIRFSSHVKRQAYEAGRKLAPSEHLVAGDLIFLFDQTGKEISHAVIYIDKAQVIDSTGVGVNIRPYEGVYKNRFAWARRVLE